MIFNTHYQYIGGGGGVPKFTYTGQYSFIDDGGGNWRIKFLTSGVFTPLKVVNIDAFLVGGGAGGKNTPRSSFGGGGGYTNTVKSIHLSANTNYNIIIGDGGAPGANGGETSGFGINAAGGNGQNGGSGGGAPGLSPGNGGSDGSDGGSASAAMGATPGGTGQGTTTREFGEPAGKLYSGGGGGGTNGNTLSQGGAGGGGAGSKSNGTPGNGEENTGGGGGGNYSSSNRGGYGGSGIAIIRNAR